MNRFNHSEEMYSFVIALEGFHDLCVKVNALMKESGETGNHYKSADYFQLAKEIEAMKKKVMRSLRKQFPTITFPGDKFLGIMNRYEYEIRK